MSTVNSICIFGGGSAGWLTALRLAHKFNFKLYVIQSPHHPNIGVGESTQPNLRQLVNDCGISLDDFMKHTDATLKHGIYYTDWNGANDFYWHPFTDLSLSGFYTTAHHYQILKTRDPENFPARNYYKHVHPSYTLAVENNLGSATGVYALHVDADKMAQYLRAHLKSRITLLEPNNIEIEHDDKQILSIQCDGTKVVADLYIDCSGFSKKLSTAIHNTELDDYVGNVNAAIFARKSYQDKQKEKFPYTRASALKNGWAWTIPLESRIGTGYAYNSDFVDHETALQEFSEYWNHEPFDITTGKISFSSRSLKNPWTSNVLNIGLSSGFIEPLEATSIAWFLMSGEVLGALLLHRYYDQETAARYNAVVRQYIEDVQDFIDVHYMLSKRRDSEYWKHQVVKERSARLLARLDGYRKNMPNKNNRNGHLAWAFNDISWIDILNGYDFKYENLNCDHQLFRQRQRELYL